MAAAAVELDMAGAGLFTPACRTALSGQVFVWHGTVNGVRPGAAALPEKVFMVKFFRVTPPSAHGMVVKLEELGLVTREPGVARSIRVGIPEDEIPKLEEIEGPAW
jgi:repressor LexA